MVHRPNHLRPVQESDSCLGEHTYVHRREEASDRLTVALGSWIPSLEASDSLRQDCCALKDGIFRILMKRKTRRKRLTKQALP